MLGQSNLLLDVGNTNIKYAWYEAGNSIADLQVMRTTLDSLPDLLDDAGTCYFCSVRDSNIADSIQTLCNTHKVPYQQVKTLAKQFGIKNAYKTPSNMGTDRWMAIVGAGALTQRNYLVVDAGTAITCDFVVSGAHVGGWIAPGLSMARETVVSNTKKVFDDASLPQVLDIGKDTPECVALGALAQLTGMLMQAKTIMYAYGASFDMYISGGDGASLISAMSHMPQQALAHAISKDSKTDSTNNQHLDLSCTISEQSSKSGSQNKLIFPSSLGTTNFIENLVLVGLARVIDEKPATTG